MSGVLEPALRDCRLVELCELDNDEAQSAYLQENPEIVASRSVEQLAATVRQCVRIDVVRALRAGDAALKIAEALDDPECRARALRAKANGLWFNSQCRPAVDLLARAITLFGELGKEDELGRTLSTSIQPLILLGEYEQALRNAEQAREIFTRQRDDLRLARLDINVANIHHRRERYTEALTIYERAYRLLLPHKDTEAIGVALHNIAVCLISLDDFDRALAIYDEARRFLQQHEMPLLTSQADYNVAYLYYLRGDYDQALERLRATRENCLAAGDAYHTALCDLDQSEIYIELNLAEEAAELAQRATEQFEKLEMGYETARSLANLAIATSLGGNAHGAMEIFDRARTLFAKEGHRAGEALADLYKAVAITETGDAAAARQLCSNANQVFLALGLRRKAIVCDLLLARLALAACGLDSALEHCQSALLQLRDIQAPVLSYHAKFLLGRIYEESGDSTQSYREYLAAREELETVRSSLQGEEMQIAFLANKVEVYERLVLLCLRRGKEGAPAHEAFDHIEQAKSRSLVDILFGRARPFSRWTSDSRSQQQVQHLRAQLNWYYHRIDLEELQQEGTSASRIEHLWEQARACEDSLLRILRATPSASETEGRSSRPPIVSLAETGTALKPDTVLLDYFQAGDEILVAVVTPKGVEVVPLVQAQRVQERLRMLTFHMSKFALGDSYVANAGDVLRLACEHHLRDLYKDLFAPLERLLNCQHLVLIPNSFLHYLPLHALYDGRQFLIDRFTVSYSPSASIYVLSQKRAGIWPEQSLVFGIHDSRAPWILGEVQEVSAQLPGPSLFLGADATRKVLEHHGAQSRFIHLATHGVFRTDNPMFSSVRLGDCYLSVYDLYNLHLPAELLTLSGCGTGQNAVAAGDELIGLARGLLHAGAHSLLLTLWDVHDRSTAEFMRAFYRNLRAGYGKAGALQSATQETRERYPHPCYWAPFVLVGKT